MADDMAARGWTRAQFAREAGVADMTVYRFLDGTTATEPAAKKLADALGFSVRRYLVSDDDSTAEQDQPILPFAGKAASR